MKTDYRTSHTAPEKGADYDKYISEFRYTNHVWNWEKRILKKTVDEFFGKTNDVSYLDFACGTGRVIQFFEQYPFHSTGVDVSESMLNEARKKTTKSELFLKDITKEKNFTFEHFNLITAFRFFLNAEQELREEAFSTIFSLLKKDGIFIFNIHLNHHCLLAYRMRIADIIRGKKRPNFNTLSVKQVEAMTKKAGLKIIQTHHFGLLPIGNENTPIPLSIIDSFESLFSKISFLKNFSRYIIFVCKRSDE